MIHTRAMAHMTNEMSPRLYKILSPSGVNATRSPAENQNEN